MVGLTKLAGGVPATHRVTINFLPTPPPCCHGANGSRRALAQRSTDCSRRRVDPEQMNGSLLSELTMSTTERQTYAGQYW
eukprot:2002856-Lingulodinium_polyedra.AAC.1